MFNRKKQSKIDHIRAYITQNIQFPESQWELEIGKALYKQILTFNDNDFDELKANLSNWTRSEITVLFDIMTFGISRKYQPVLSHKQLKNCNDLFTSSPYGYIHPDLRKWRANFSVNSTTKSNNRKVLDVYDIILKNEYSDTDFWYCCRKDYFDPIFKKFNAADWEALIIDLQNWRDLHLEIFSICLTDSYDSNTIYLAEKSEIYTTILDNCHEGTFMEIIDDFHFLKFNTNKEISILKRIKKRCMNVSQYKSNNWFKDCLALINEEIAIAKNNTP